MLRARATEVLKQALFLHNQNQCCNYFPHGWSLLWWRKLRFNQCNSPRSCQLDSSCLEQRLLALAFFSPMPTKKLGGEEMKLVVSQAKLYSIGTAPPHKAYIYHNYISFRGSSVILTLTREHNTKPSKPGSSVSLQSPIPSVLFLLCHWAKHISIL